MAHYNKNTRHSPEAPCQAVAAETFPAPAASEHHIQPPLSQPPMRRHIHLIPQLENDNIAHTYQQTTLLRTLEQQNALLTDLISAVNGLAALICSRGSS